MSNTGKPYVPIMTLKECMEAEQPLSTSGQEIAPWNTREFADLVMGFAKIGEMLNGPARNIMEQVKSGMDAAAHSPAVQALESQWIRVEDKLPPKDGSEVILRIRRAGLMGSVVAHWMPGGHCIEDHPPIDEGWYWWNERYFDLAPKPTHWMPLPAPPVESLSKVKAKEE